MPQTLRATIGTSKPARAKSHPPKGGTLYHILPFERFLRDIWPQDRTKNYMRLTGAKHSTAKQRVRGKFAPDYAEIVAILRSEHGLDWIRHALGDARPAWFADFNRAKNIGETRKLQAQLHRRIAQLEMEIE